MFKYITINRVIVVLLTFLVIAKIVDWMKPIAPSEKEIRQKIRIELLERKSQQFIKNRKLRRTKNEETAKKITTDSLFIWNANREYRDSLRSIINPS